MQSAHAFADKSILIAGRFFYGFNDEMELNAHLDEVAPHWERIELPESFPCLAEFLLDEHEEPYPVFFAEADVEMMRSFLRGPGRTAFRIQP